MTTLTVDRPRRTNGHIPPPPPPTRGGDGPDREPGPRRPLLDNVRLAMLFLICGEVMFFGGLVSAFLVLRVTAANWRKYFSRPPSCRNGNPVAISARRGSVTAETDILLTPRHAPPLDQAR